MEPFCYKAKVVRVVDGDTMILDIDLGFDVVLRNQSVRLYKVDTPECRTRNLKEKAAGKLAKKVVDGFVNVGDSVVVKTKLDSKGKFGRLLLLATIQRVLKTWSYSSFYCTATQAADKVLLRQEKN